MDDLISRQAAIDAIDECYCGGEDSCGEPWIYQENAVEAIQMIEPIPPAEPQIIRCKDCKNWDTTWTNDFSPNYHYCPMVDGVRKEDWFCADAERRTDE